MNNYKIKNILLVVIGVSVPYFYYFFIRKKLLEYEKIFDDKITKISDQDLIMMKKRMQNMDKSDKNVESMIKSIDKEMDKRKSH